MPISLNAQLIEPLGHSGAYDPHAQLKAVYRNAMF